MVMRTKGPGFGAAVNAIAATLCISVGGTANENERNTTDSAYRTYHPYLAPAPPLTEMEAGGPVERAIARSAKALFPELAKGALPTTAFGTIMLPSFSSPSVLLFRKTDAGTLVEKREFEFGIHLRDLTPDERPNLVTVSKVLHPEIVTASKSAIRGALANARPHRSGGMRDGESYYFFSRGIFGTAHSPGSATEAGKLVHLVWVLSRFADGAASERELRQAAENALGAVHGSATEG